MKKILLLIYILSIISCSKNENSETIIQANADAKNISVLIHPNQTDANYASTNQSHYVIRNSKTHLNKLLLFIGGFYYY